ncbi:hypothetical protein AXF42_Ash021070 [Apostasia shenzhenica]|uniref:Uncharacterized protein n=1 Tax=Apostasia shenzhenica TaxID=1088818 RepID=A0A2I0A4H9_9ASPA|nr:hypothetical protein AXF42_Ash021070 [Apostasia shenzhenica]
MWSVNQSVRFLVSLPGLRHALPIGPRAPLPTHLETQTKESDKRVSRRVQTPGRHKQANAWDPYSASTTDRPRSYVKGSSRSMSVGTRKMNWQCGMNRKPGYGAQLCANLEPTKGVGRLRQQDSSHGS